VNTQIVRFAVVGVVGFIVDGGGTFLLVRAGFSPFVARVPALAAAILTTWVLNRTLTFRAKHPRSVSELARYVSVALSSALLNYLLYGVLVASGIAPLIAVAVATVVLMLGSFFAYRRVVFR
jgi:putative flippase GtrA